MKLKDVIESANTGLDAIQRAPIVNYDTGIKCLRIGDISQKNNFENWGFSKVNEENFKKFKLKKNDILIARTGNTIGVNIIIKKDLNSVYNNGLIRLRIKNKYNPLYIYYLIQSKKFNNYIKSICFGTSTQPNMKINDLLEFEIPNIELNKQSKIANILEKLDNKIELNNQTNDNLFELTKQLYKRWFIEFEFPNKDGNPYKASNGKMVESELGLIPENWCIKRLDEISVNFDSKRKPLSSKDREERKGNIPYYGATSIIDYVNEYIFDDIFVLMGEDGSVINSDNTPVLQYIWKKCWINNHAHVLQGKGISTEHLMECLRATDVSSIITGAVQLKINQANMNALKYVYATEETNRDFDEKISKIYEKIRANIEQNEILEQLRDTLLPKLMNGEIDLDKIEI